MAFTVDGDGVTIDVDGDADAFASQLESAITRAFADAGSKIGKQLSRNLNKIGSDAGKRLSDSLNTAGRSAEGAAKNVDRLNQRLKAIVTQNEGLTRSIGKSFDPRALAAFDAQLVEMNRLMADVDRSAGVLDDNDFRQIRLGVAATNSALIASREAFKVAGRAADEAERNITRDTRQESRERVSIRNDERARFVVTTQAQSAAARDAARIETEAVKASSRQRVALIQAAARTIASTERGLRAVFQGTTTAISGAFRGIGSIGSGAARSLSLAFNRSGNQIRNDYANTFNSATNTVRNQTRAQSSIINNFAQSAQRSLGSVGAGTLAVGGILAGVGAKIFSGGFDRATTLETANRGLEVLLGNAEQAQALLSDVVGVVTGTPFRLDQFAEGAARLVAFNVQAEKIPSILAAAGDAAALSGKDAAQTIDTLIRITGQATATGKLYGDSILQLGDAGIPALRILGNAFNEQTADIQELLTDGTIPAEKALDALFKGIVEGTDGVNGVTRAFGGLAKELGTTLSGAVSNFSIAFARFGANLFKLFTPAIVASLTAGTKALDLLGKAAAGFASGIANSPIFGFVTDQIERFGEVIGSAGSSWVPIMERLGSATFAFGLAVASLKTIGALPAILNLLALAARRVFTPMNLLIAAGIGLAAFIEQAVESSPDLQIALRDLGSAFAALAAPLQLLATGAMRVVTTAIDSFLAPAVSSLAETVAEKATPVIERLTNFLNTRVVPALHEAAAFIFFTVIPRVGSLLATAVDFGTEAFRRLWQFTSGTLVPFFVGPLTAGFRAVTGFLTAVGDRIAPFIDPLVTGIRELGGAFRELFASGDFSGLGDGFRAVGSGIAGTVANIGNAIANGVLEGVRRAREALVNLVDSGTLTKVGIGVLKVANKIGQVLGDVLTDRRLLTAAGAVLAAGVAVAGSFVVGLVQGVIGNIPELVDGLSNAIGIAFEAVWDKLTGDPKLLAGLVALIAGASAVSALRAASVKTGSIIAAGLAQGAASRAIGSGFAGGGNSAADFTRALFGGRDAIQAAGTKAGADYAASMARTISRDARLIKAIQGTSPALTQARGEGGRFTGGPAGTPANLKITRDTLADLEAQYGKATVAGAQFRLGLSQLNSGLRNLNSGGLAGVQEGLSNLGGALRRSGAQVAQAAGAVAGGAFATSFISRALFDINSTGADKLQAGLGLAATGAGIFAVTGSPLLAAGAVGIGLLAGAFASNAERAKEAAAAVRDYAQALEGLTDPGERAEAISERFFETLRNAGGDIRESLIDAKFNYEEFAAAVEAGRLDEEFGNLSVDAITLSRIFEGLTEQGEFPFIEQLRDSGVTFSDTYELLRFINEEIDRIEGGISQQSQLQTLADINFDPSVRALETIRSLIEASGGASGVATGAAQAYRDKLTELNDQRLDGLRNQVDTTKSALDEARGAADDARQAFIDFVSGANQDLSLEGATNQAVSNIGRIAGSLTEQLGKAGGIAAADLELTFGNVQEEIGRVLNAGQFTSEPEARAALFPLIAAAQEIGGDAGDEIKRLIEESLSNFNTTEGRDLLKNALDLESEIPKLQEQLDSAENRLRIGLELDPELIPNIAAEAAEAFEQAGADSAAGFAAGFDGSTLGKDAAQKMADDALAAVRESLGINSPSTVFAEVGEFSAEGYAKGLQSGARGVVDAVRNLSLAAARAAQAGGVARAWESVGRFAAEGIASGIRSRSSAAISAARSLANAVASEMRRALQVESPSKVTYEVGVFAGQGFVNGLEVSLTGINGPARVARAAVRQVSALAQAMADALGQGFAENGPSFFGSVAGAIDEAYNEALSRVDQFKVIGKEIASALFDRQGTGAGGVFGGGTNEAQLQRARLDILSVADEFFQKNRDLVEEFGFGGLSFDDQFSTGRENQANFLDAGLDIRDYAQALLDAGRPIESVVNDVAFLRDQLVNAARAAGSELGTNAGVVDRLLEQLGLTNSQLDDFVKSVREVERATEQATREAEARIEAERLREEQEQRAREEEDRRREEERNTPAPPGFLPPPLFRDLIVQTPAGNPEAVALETANRVAFKIRR